MAKLCAILAMSEDGFISDKDGKLPWKSKRELEYFKEMTMGKTAVMGRKTWKSLPPSVRPLTGRRNIVLTRADAFEAQGAEILRKPEDVARMVAESETDVYIIGGREIYELFINSCDFVSLTTVGVNVREGTRAPDMSRASWLVESKPSLSFVEDGIPFNVYHYTRLP